MINVGKLGRFEFEPGLYVYLGSARGPGGLRARLERHIRGGEKTHWHIDFLRQLAMPIAVFWSTEAAVSECGWRVDVCKLPGAQVSVPGFGAGDCRAGCPAHLVYFAPPENLRQWTDEIKINLSGRPDGQLLRIG